MKSITLTEAELKKLLGEILSAANDMQDINYFRATEKLLYNYKRLKALVEDEEAYLKPELRRTSKSLVYAASRKSISDIDPIERLQRQRAISYERTKLRVAEIDNVIKLFEEKKEFVIVRMYYFNEDVQGRSRSDEHPYTWEEMMFELSEENILHDAKTARKWRNNIINDMAVCLFGKPAAVSACRHI